MVCLMPNMKERRQSIYRKKRHLKKIQPFPKLQQLQSNLQSQIHISNYFFSSDLR